MTLARIITTVGVVAAALTVSPVRAADAEPVKDRPAADDAPVEQRPPQQDEEQQETNGVAVLVLPFQPVAQDERPAAWIGEAISETLTSDLSVDGRLDVSTGDAPAADAEAAADAGKQARAAFVVFGSYQKIDGQLRITGRILDVAKGEVTAGAKATGPVRDLFALQDSLADQVQRRLLNDALPEPDAVAADDGAADMDDEREAEAGRDDQDDADLDRDRLARGPDEAEEPELGLRAPARRRDDDWDEPADGPLFARAARAGVARYYYQPDFDPWYYSGGYIGIQNGRYSSRSYRYRHDYCPPDYGVSPGHHHHHHYYHRSPIRTRVSRSPSGWANHPTDRTPGRGHVAGATRMTQRPQRRR